MGKALAVHSSSGHGQQSLLLRPAPGLYILTPAIWGGWVMTATMRSVLFCPVANSKIRTSWDTYGLGLMLNGSLGTGSGLLQIRSDQAWTEVAWKVAEAVQQELEVPSSRTGSSTSETGSGLAGTQVT